MCALQNICAGFILMVEFRLPVDREALQTPPPPCSVPMFDRAQWFVLHFINHLSESWALENQPNKFLDKKNTLSTVALFKLDLKLFKVH